MNLQPLLALLPTFAISLGLTLILEWIIALLCRLRGRDYLLLVLVNILTNPAVVYLNMVFSAAFPNGGDLWQIPLELAAVAVEALCYRKFARSIHRPWMFSLVANGFSYGCGLLLETVF